MVELACNKRKVNKNKGGKKASKGGRGGEGREEKSGKRGGGLMYLAYI
jgi:hypothetical protein